MKEIDQKTRKITTMYGGLYRRSNVERLYLPRSEGGSGVVITEDCVSDERQNLALYVLRSNEKRIITATAELNKAKTTSDRMKRESSSRSVLERNRKH